MKATLEDGRVVELVTAVRVWSAPSCFGLVSSENRTFDSARYRNALNGLPSTALLVVETKKPREVKILEVLSAERRVDVSDTELASKIDAAL